MGGGGSATVDEKFPNVNSINFAEVDKGGGIDAYPPKVDNVPGFFGTLSLVKFELSQQCNPQF